MKKVLNFFLIIAMVFCSLSGCKGAEKRLTKSVYAMNTVMTLTAYGKNAKAGLEKCEAEIKRLEKLLSFTDGGSDIAKINAVPGEYALVSGETASLVSRAKELSEMTDGSFDITLGALSKEWGFVSGEKHVPDPEELLSLLKKTGTNQIDVENNSVCMKSGALVDLGGIAKGYTGDRLCEILRESGVDSAILSLGGNVMTLGEKVSGDPWKIEIADPFDTSKSIGELTVGANTAVVTSGDYQQYFIEDGKKYHHILDPNTGFPSDSGLSSVTVICSNGTNADALSTALFVMGKEKALELYNKQESFFEAVFVLKDGNVEVTPGLSESFVKA